MAGAALALGVHSILLFGLQSNMEGVAASAEGMQNNIYVRLAWQTQLAQGSPAEVPPVPQAVAGTPSQTRSSEISPGSVGVQATPRQVPPSSAQNGSQADAGESGNAHAPLPGAENTPGAGAVPLALTGNPSPSYPELARQRGQEGRVVLLVQVDQRGQPISVTVHSSSGYFLLDESALSTVRKWRFAPGSAGGQAASGQLYLPIEFRLN